MEVRPLQRVSGGSPTPLLLVVALIAFGERTHVWRDVYRGAVILMRRIRDLGTGELGCRRETDMGGVDGVVRAGGKRKGSNAVRLLGRAGVGGVLLQDGPRAR